MTLTWGGIGWYGSPQPPSRYGWLTARYVTLAIGTGGKPPQIEQGVQSGTQLDHLLPWSSAYRYLTHISDLKAAWDQATQWTLARFTGSPFPRG